jgi:hypothetical protein
MAAIGAETPHQIVGHRADRFGILERADHHKTVLAPAPALNDELPGDLAPPKNDGLDIPPCSTDARPTAARKSRPASIS